MCFCASVCPLGKVRALSGALLGSPRAQPPSKVPGTRETLSEQLPGAPRCGPSFAGTGTVMCEDSEEGGLLCSCCPMSRLQGCWGRAQPQRTPHHSGTSSRREACWLVSLVHSFSRVSVPSSDKYPSGPTATSGGAGRPSRDSDCTHRRTSWRW